MCLLFISSVVYKSTNGLKNENFSIQNSIVKMGKNGKVSDFKSGGAIKNFLAEGFTISMSRNTTVNRHYFFINFSIFHCVYITLQCNVTSLHNSSNLSLHIQFFYENTSYIECEVLRNIYLHI